MELMQLAVLAGTLAALLYVMFSLNHKIAALKAKLATRDSRILSLENQLRKLGALKGAAQGKR